MPSKGLMPISVVKATKQVLAGHGLQSRPAERLYFGVTLLSRRSRQRERLSASMLSIYLFVSLLFEEPVWRQNAKKRDFLKN